MIDLKHEILTATGASSIVSSQSVQTLWSGYGQIKRFYLSGGEHKSIIVKHIQLPNMSQHPRGWNTDLSHQRKLKSYQVESYWYQHYAPHTDNSCRIPTCYSTLQEGSELLLIMEDLNASGFAVRLQADTVTLKQAKICLSWLAHFHAKFMNIAPHGLWPIGTYWHLETRPDEWGKMENSRLKKAAKAIDEQLSQAKHQTIIHGDAKLANFCFGDTAVAAVDFQYVGKGCGMKDVAYFISSCFDAKTCAKYEEEFLQHYFNQLELSLDKAFEFQEVKDEWNKLYAYAWADFYRFLDGWSPDHWKMHHYSQQLTQKVLNELL